MNGLPTINRPITLTSISGQEFASRVEDVGDDWLTVARPLDLPAGLPIENGSDLTASWKAPGGLCVMPCRLVSTRREGTIRLWDVNVAGRIWLEQRRAYVRTTATGAVAMRWSTDDESEREISGALEDLSEAALRFQCRDRDLDARALVGKPVEMTLRMRDDEFDLAAEVLRVARSVPSESDRGPAPWQIVLVYTNPGRAADDLRRIVFREQLRERNCRSALGSTAGRRAPTAMRNSGGSRNS